MISIVITGRNDNYGGNFEERLIDTLRHNAAGLEARGVPFEVVYVEWNPLSETPPLAERLVYEHACVRAFVVDPLLHRHLCDNVHIGVMEYHAKNIGVLRARGHWILTTNPDNYMGAGVLDLLAGPLDENTLYRAERVDIVDPRDVDNPDIPPAFPGDEPPYTCGSGDFTLCSRALWERAGGYREDLRFTNTHKDSIFLHTLCDLGATAVKSGATYHVVHERELESDRRIQFRWDAVDRAPQAQFGHADILVEEPQGERLTFLRLHPDLREAAQRRAIPQPRTPRPYRLRQRPTLKGLRRFLRRRGLIPRR